MGGPSRQKSEIGMYDLVITGLGCQGFHGIISIYPYSEIIGFLTRSHRIWSSPKRKVEKQNGEVDHSISGNSADGSPSSSTEHIESGAEYDQQLEKLIAEMQDKLPSE